MNLLEPLPGCPGRWRNPAWKGGPGAFAVVLGVSAYTHLNGAYGPPKRGSYGLGSLPVSALTAHAFFTWLIEDYAREGCPLAEVWLLLAPTDEEKNRIPAAVLEHQRLPNLAACQEAIRGWHATMDDLPMAAAAESQSFFFFSGHGLEIQRDCQVLLPADYLAPSSTKNDALSTANLAAGVTSLRVPQHLFFIDACRSEVSELRAHVVDGVRTLDVPVNGGRPEVVTPIFYACAATLQTWSPRSPADGLSVYGAALIAGLRGEPDYRPPPPHTVSLFALVDDVSERITTRLRGQHATMPRLGGVIINVPITENSALREARPAPPAPLAVLQSKVGPRSVLDAFELEVINPSTGAAVAFTRKTTWDPEQGCTRVTVETAAVDAPRRLMITDATGTIQTAVMPACGGEPLAGVRWLIEAREADANTPPWVQLLLARDNPGLLGEVAELWGRYHSNAFDEVVERLRDLLPRVLDERAPGGPLAVLVAAMVLVRVQRLLDRRESGLIVSVSERLRELAVALPQVPDCLVLHHQLSNAIGEPETNAALDLVQLAARPLPSFVEPLAALSTLVERALLVAVDGRRDVLTLLQQRVHQALALVRPDGLCCVYLGPGPG